MKYLIHSRRHANGQMMWLKPGGMGWIADLHAAGRFSASYALDRARNSSGQEIPVPAPTARAMNVRVAIDLTDATNRAALTECIARMDTALRNQDEPGLAEASLAGRFVELAT